MRPCRQWDAFPHAKCRMSNCEWLNRMRSLSDAGCGKGGSADWRELRQNGEMALKTAGVCWRLPSCIQRGRGIEGPRGRGLEGVASQQKITWDKLGLPGTSLVRNGEERMTSVDNGCFATFQGSFEAARGMGADAREHGSRRLDAPFPMPISLAQCSVRVGSCARSLWGRELGNCDSQIWRTRDNSSQLTIAPVAFVQSRGCPLDRLGLRR